MIEVTQDHQRLQSDEQNALDVQASISQAELALSNIFFFRLGSRGQIVGRF